MVAVCTSEATPHAGKHQSERLNDQNWAGQACFFLLGCKQATLRLTHRPSRSKPHMNNFGAGVKQPPCSME